MITRTLLTLVVSWWASPLIRTGNNIVTVYIVWASLVTYILVIGLDNTLIRFGAELTNGENSAMMKHEPDTHHQV